MPEPSAPKGSFIPKAKPRQSLNSETLPETPLQTQVTVTEPVPSAGATQPPAPCWHRDWLNPKAGDEKGRAGKGRLMAVMAKTDADEQ